MRKVVNSACVGLVFMAVSAPAIAEVPAPGVALRGDLWTQRMEEHQAHTGDGPLLFRWRLDDNPRHNPDPDSFSEVRGWADATQGMGAYSAVGGNIVDYQPGQYDHLEAESRASIVIPFRLDPITAPEGASVPVRLRLSLRGQLSAFGSANVFRAAGGLYADITEPGTDYLSYYDAEVAVGPQAVHPSLWVNDEDYTASIEGSVSATPFPDGLTAAVNWAQEFTFDAIVGHTYVLGTFVETETITWPPVDALAIADFEHSGSATLAATSDSYRLVIVPEPGVVMVLVIGAAAMATRRRTTAGRPAGWAASIDA